MCAGLFYPSSVGVPDSLRQGWGLHQWYGIIGDSSRECPQPPGERQSGQRIQREDDRRDASWIAKTPKMCYDHYHSETQDSQPTGIPQWALKFRSVDGSSAQPRSLRVSNLNRFQTKEAVISLQVLYQWFFFLLFPDFWRFYLSVSEPAHFKPRFLLLIWCLFFSKIKNEMRTVPTPSYFLVFTLTLFDICHV